jgi:hypothetical protein
MDASWWHVWRRWRVEDDRGPAGPVVRWAGWECDGQRWADESDAHDWAETLSLTTPRETETVVLAWPETPYLVRV